MFPMLRFTRLTLLTILTLLAPGFLAGCSRLPPPGPDQPLLVGLPADPIFQQAALAAEGMDGFSRDLTALFAESLDVSVHYVSAPNYPAALEMVRSGKVHLAATLPIQESDPTLRFSPPLREARQLIVRHSSTLPIDSPSQLAGREILAMPGAPQIAVIKALEMSSPPVIVEVDHLDEIEMLTAVARQRRQFAATTDLHYAVAANLHPDLDEALVLPGKLSYVWAMHADDSGLEAQLTRFIDEMKRNGTLRRLDDRYFGHIRRINSNDMTAFLGHARTRLQDFRADFQEAQEITGIDWRLLAALAYQESKWDPLATSYTNVRGLMMLTEDTADRMGVTNRLDPKQSIRAGAKYLATLMDELPDEVKHPDRLWFALAAYNLGMGHLRGARIFAPSLNRDPNLWVDMKQVLPLMARPEYYTRLKSGRARGGEAVILVENIRNYYDVLTRLAPIFTPPSLAANKTSVKKMKRKTPK